jgi:hypothetical protein
MGVTNSGSCASSQSSGSPLVLGNQKLREEALLIGRKSQYLCTVEIKPIPPIPAFGPSLFIFQLPVLGAYKPYFRLRCQGGSGFVYRLRWFQGKGV